MPFTRELRRAMSRRKSLAEANGSTAPHDSTEHVGLKRSLTATDLILYGIGSSVGAGIYVLVGLGAKIAGPSISLSFFLCGTTCILTSLCYAEFAARIPATGSAFIYAYVAFGEFIAFLVGWNLTLGYGFTAAVVARAWADYLGDLLFKLSSNAVYRTLLEYLSAWKLFGGSSEYTCSPLSIVINGGSTYILLRGAQDSSRFSNLMTVLNIAVLMVVILSGLLSNSVDIDNLSPFLPHGMKGLVSGAGLVFFAFIGFDMVASLSEEVVHPERNMPIGIVGSLVVSTLLYVVVALVVVGMAPISILGEKVPVVRALLANACCNHEQQLGNVTPETCLSECEHVTRPLLARAGQFVSVGAIMGLTASCFTSLMGQPRILYSLARDRLIPPIFATVDPETRVPRAGILATGGVSAFLACFVPLDALANLISLGTLMVFTFVDAGVILLRLRSLQSHFHPPPPLKHVGGASSTFPPVVSIPGNKRLAHHYDPIRHKDEQVVILISIFTGSVLGMSLCLSHFYHTVVATLFSCLIVLSAYAIATSSDTWSIPTTSTGTNTRPFQCPFVPIFPLAGILANTYMMGSLPLSSWFLCLVWLSLGIGFYFCYSLHHSVLGKSSSTSSHHATEDRPLLSTPTRDATSTLDASCTKHTYDTLEVSLHALTCHHSAEQRKRSEKEAPCDSC